MSRVPAFPLRQDLVLLSPERDRLHVLNPSGRLIWEAHQAGRGPADICTALFRRYGIGERQAWRDLEVTLAQWKDAGLLGTRSARNR